MKSLKIRKSVLIFSLLFVLASLLIIPGTLFAEETDETAEEAQVEESINFDITYPEIKAKDGEQFTFKADLNFVGEEETTFNITAEAPEGWYISIQPSYEAVDISAVKIKPSSKESLKFVAIPLTSQEPGDYIIKIKASNDELSAEAELKAVITATYELDFTPTNGMFNTKVTSGKDNHFALQLKNKGSAPIEKITFTSSGPQGWTTKYDPADIETLDAGKTQDIDIAITPPDKTIAGDYMLTLNVSSENSTDKIELRVTVQTPTIWGWVGIGIIAVVIIGIGFIFAKLGRR
ncbi:MAG: NEW3 domain-containing protein [Actinomycetota bacterium]|nr:NEW3 domain-containing protein [Actinomycetota bacterium]